MKQKKFRLTYREHSEEEIADAIRKAIPEGGVLSDVLSEACLEVISGSTEWERGIKEGSRRFAGWLLMVARSEPAILDGRSEPTAQMASEKVLNAEGD